VRTLHAVVKKDPPNMDSLLLEKKKKPFLKLSAFSSRDGWMVKTEI
jgi:hypothetical protein